MIQSVCVIGLGYIGLPTAVLLANTGYRVFGYDINAVAVDKINAGQLPLVEPGLEEQLQASLCSKLFHADVVPHPADAYMLCVPTPTHEENGVHVPDLSYVFTAAKTIAPLLKAGDCVILESTSPVGTTEEVVALLAEQGIDTSKLHFAYCPERVLPGKAMVELVENDRIVGGVTPQATDAVVAFYKTFVRGAVLGTNARTAEMSKLVENSYRDVNIAFANELSILCHNQDIDVWELIGLANRHPRVNILQPGPGVGGHCIAVDPWFVVAKDPDNAKLIRRAREVNLHKTDWVLNAIESRIAQYVKEHGTAPTVGCFGLAFKPDIDDLRESPALEIAHKLIAKGHRVVGVEPHISAHPDVALMSTVAALEECNIHVVLVKHTEFQSVDWQAVADKRAVLDFCGVTR